MKSVYSLILFASLALLCQSQFLPIEFEGLKLREKALQLSSEWKEGLELRLEEVNQDRDLSNKLNPSDVLLEFFKLLRGTAFPTAFAKNISQQCIDDSLTYVKALYLTPKEIWAHQMHESTAKGAAGFFRNFLGYEYGLFDECLAVKGPKFNGKYCNVAYLPTTRDYTPPKIDELEDLKENYQLLRTEWIDIMHLWNLITGHNGTTIEPDIVNEFPIIAIPYGVPFAMGMCVPSSCSAEDLGKAVGQVIGTSASINPINETITSITTFTDEKNCFTDNKDPPQFDSIDITVLVLLSVIGLLILLASLAESWRIWSGIHTVDPKRDGLSIRMLLCFSAINNGRKLLSTKTGAGNLTCLNGIRFLSTTWVVIGHFFLGLASNGPNKFLLLEDAKKWSFQALGNATVSVDTFFLISGLLVAYLLLKELERNKGRFNIVLFYVHRYLRLTPVYAIILGFVATLLVYTGSGPGWALVQFESDQCRQNWWTNLLYINNLLTTPNSCMGVTWYLANDMQFYLISPLLIYPLWRWGIHGVIWIALVTLASLGINIYVFISGHHNPTIFPLRQEKDYGMSFMHDIYTSPWCRIPPYLVGIILGYILHNTRKMPVKMNWITVTLGWSMATATALAVLYGLSGLVDPAVVKEIDEATSVIYGTFHRLAWAVAVGWLIFACSTGYGGPVNRILSWKPFIPLSRMTYCVYLMHLSLIVNVYTYHSRAPFYYTIFDAVLMSIAIIATAFGLAFICSVTIEAPFLNLEKLIFSPMKANSEKLATTVNNFKGATEIEAAKIP